MRCEAETSVKQKVGSYECINKIDSVSNNGDDAGILSGNRWRDGYGNLAYQTLLAMDRSKRRLPFIGRKLHWVMPKGEKPKR